jgi:cytochrome c-type biogenesis protein CcmH
MIIVLLFLVQTSLGVPQGAALSGDALERRTEEVAALLRCPVCQGLSVADSPSAMALNMKQRVRELLSQGYTQEQILISFERSYGPFVRLNPPRRGINWLVWLGPVLALLVGAAILVLTLKGRKPRPATVDSELDPYIARVRDLTHDA